MRQVLNQSFQDWSATRKFPFTDASDMTCGDGRRIPVSAFSIIVIIPDIEGSARISTIDTQGIHFDMDGWTADALFDDYLDDGWIPIMKAGSCVGTVMTNDDDLSYIKGMAVVAPMVFTEGHLDIRPECVRGFCRNNLQLVDLPTFFGYPAETLTVSMDSERFSESGYYVDVNTTPTVVNVTPSIQAITVNGTSYDIRTDGHLTIRTPIWCSTQVISTGDSLVFHQRGM